MIRNLSDLEGFAIGASDGSIGKVKDAYFDDQDWALRYLVVDTGTWLSSRKVLITPLSIRDLDWDARRIDVGLNREQVENSPDIDTDKPVSRQHEAAHLKYYNYPYYWTGPYLWGAIPYPVVPVGESPDQDAIGREMNERSARQRQAGQAGDTHLRSAMEVTGYHIEATDGAIGHIEDFLFDDKYWSIRYFLVDTRNWLPGKRVLVSPEALDRVSWPERKVHVNLTKDAIRESPDYEKGMVLSPGYEVRLREHYGHRSMQR